MCLLLNLSHIRSSSACNSQFSIKCVPSLILPLILSAQIHLVPLTFILSVCLQFSFLLCLTSFIPFTLKLFLKIVCCLYFLQLLTSINSNQILILLTIPISFNYQYLMVQNIVEAQKHYLTSILTNQQISPDWLTFLKVSKNKNFY